MAFHDTAVRTVRAHLSLVNGCILLFAFWLRVVNVGELTEAIWYYYAAVQSMLHSWHNWFFGALEAGGALTVNKPPVGLWIQASVVKMIGLHSFGMALPQALAGVVSVALLGRSLRQIGRPTALIGAFALAVHPLSVAVERTNNLEGILLCVLLGATVLLLEDRPILAFALLGIAFNIKHLQALLVLPAFLVYLFSANRSLKSLLPPLSVGLFVALSWSLIVTLTPATHRPYISNTQGNSAWELIVGYNGLVRLGAGITVGERCFGICNAQNTRARQAVNADEIGTAGVLRLVKSPLLAQIGWLLPLALVGFGSTDWRNRHVQFWAVWLLTMVVLFSAMQGRFRAYYLVMLAPALAAGFGLGWKSGRVWRICLAVGLGISAIMAVGVALNPRPNQAHPTVSWGEAHASVSVLQAQVTTLQKLGTLPTQAAYPLATVRVSNALPFILAWDQPILPLGGMSGDEPVVTSDRLRKMLTAGEIGYILDNDNFTKGRPDLYSVAQQFCEPVEIEMVQLLECQR